MTGMGTDVTICKVVDFTIGQVCEQSTCFILSSNHSFGMHLKSILGL
jgi:hypothetical protein